MIHELKQALTQQAIREGFTRVGFTKPDAIPDAAGALQEFVDQDYHGSMHWMAERMAWRGNPAALWPGAKSVIVLAESYTPDYDPLDILKEPSKAAISVYARNRDYHDIVKKRLKRLGRWLLDQATGEIKVFVDTAPVMEKPLGQAAGLGWQGKHTNLVSREIGNWFFLGSIFTTIEFSPDSAETDHCGSCRACLDVCPTNAFPAPYRLDARKCISYLTIEHKGPVPDALRPLMGNRIYGCDDCLAVCPWNKFAASAAEMRYAAREDIASADLKDLVGLDDAAFRARFSGSPIKRIGRNQFIRNVLYAIGNSGDPGLQQAAGKLVNDDDDAVSNAATWAVNKLATAA